MKYILIMFIGYFLGTFNLAYFLSKKQGFDIRTKGSKNAGASNATITMGWKVGVFVALVDILKSIFAITIAKLFFQNIEIASVLAGASAVIGHMYPFYMNFKGGKGFASYIGTIIGLNWKLTLFLAFGIIAITIITDYIPLATMATVISFPAYEYITNPNIYFSFIMACVSLIIIYKHLPNMKRIITGNEIGLSDTLKRKNKI